MKAERNKKNAPDGKIVKADVSIAKNYLSMLEMRDLNQFVSMYLDYAERQVRKRIPMTMEDWAKKLDVFLALNEETILRGKGSVTAEIAKAKFKYYYVHIRRWFDSNRSSVVAKFQFV